MFSHAVHLSDGRAALQERLVDALLVGQGHAGRRQGEQCGAAPRNQAQHQIVGGQALHRGENAFGRRLAGGVGHRMRRLDHLDAAARRAMAVARHDQAFERSRPMILDSLRHRAGGLAGADDNRAPGRRLWQMRRHASLGRSGVHGGFKHVQKQLTGIKSHGGLRLPQVVGRISEPAAARKSQENFEKTARKSIER